MQLAEESIFFRSVFLSCMRMQFTATNPPLLAQMVNIIYFVPQAKLNSALLMVLL